MGRIHSPERAEKGGSSLACPVAIVEQANEGREADRVGEQHALVVGLVGGLADTVEEVDPGFELLLRQAHLAANACRCRTRAAITSRSRGLAAPRIAASTLSVTDASSSMIEPETLRGDTFSMFHLRCGCMSERGFELMQPDR